MLDPLGTGIGHPGDQHLDDLAALHFDTSVLKEPLELAGCPEATLAIERTELRDLRLSVKFCDVDKDGHSELLTTGWLRVREQFSGDSGGRLSVPAGPIAAVLLPGHRLRVAISSCDFPRAWPTPGPAGFALVLGGEKGSCVRVPVIADVAHGADHDIEVPRPPVLPRPDWVKAGTVCYRETREEPGGVFEAALLNYAGLAPPSGSLFNLDERFTARLEARDFTTAMVTANVTIGVELPEGELVQVHVETEFTETSAQASGSVTLDGEVIFNQSWAFPEDE